MKKYPFKFLESYKREDRDIFFGRDEEIDVLYEMVFQTSVMLIYGASGTGKTSLINCGLAGKFQPHDWLSLMILRGNNLNESLEKALRDAGGTDDVGPLNEWADQTKITKSPLSQVGRCIEAIYQRSFKPVYLIFDQFEELFILGSTSEQNLFIKTIEDILQSEQPVKLIFSIREEYLGHLFEFERALPQLLQKKLRVEPMNLEKVRQIIAGATENEDSKVRMKPGESTLVAEGIFEKIKGQGKSFTIQLPFLQVFLDKFYLKITNDKSYESEALFSLQALKDMGEIGDVLINFLEEQVTNISNALKEKYTTLTPEMIWKILSPFSTLEGTKEPISKDGLYDRLAEYNTAMIDDVVNAFINSRILRYNDATDMFEIAHDSLAKPISERRSVEETALLEIKRLIKNQVTVKDEARAYFTERQLLFIEPYLDKLKVSSEENDWISKSRNDIQEQKKKRQDQFLNLQKAKATKKWLYVVS
ncbi:MAG TPA: ATP-binding protein, partial [Chitinophagaceae bacterium]|nr:ATP-binding protein [Chitinophagaceae bacterium]